MKAWLEGIWAPLSWLGAVVLVWPVLRAIATSIFDYYPSPPLEKLFSIPWYYFAGFSVLFFVGAGLAHHYSPQREIERQATRQEQKNQQAKLDMWRTWNSAFIKGSASEYPTVNTNSFGYIPKPGEICYMATAQAVLGRGNAHQLEISESSNAGIAFKGASLGEAKGTKDSYSTIRYDESHPGSLVISNQRVSFIAAPSTFIDLSPDQILRVAFTGQYLMMRTTLADDSKNLVAIRIAGELPAWLFASAIYRATVDYAASTPPVPKITS